MDTQHKRILSVIIPVQDNARTLDPLLDQLAALKRPADWEVEVIAAYQDSADGSLDRLKARGVRWARSASPGRAAACNAAVSASTGELLYFIDADACPVGDGFLLRLVESAGRWERPGAFGGPILLDPKQSWNPIAVADHTANWYVWHHRRRLSTIPFQPDANLVIPRAVFEAAGGFDTSLDLLQDFDLEQRIHRAGHGIYFDPFLAVTHRARGGLLASWRNSWRRGRPVREIFYRRMRGHPLQSMAEEGDTVHTFLAVLRHRMGRVFYVSWRVSKTKTLFCAPFLFSTVFVWALAVASGKAKPPREKLAPTP